MDGWMDGDEKAGRERESGVLLVWGCGWYVCLVGWLFGWLLGCGEENFRSHGGWLMLD